MLVIMLPDGKVGCATFQVVPDFSASTVVAEVGVRAAITGVPAERAGLDWGVRRLTVPVTPTAATTATATTLILILRTAGASRGGLAMPVSSRVSMDIKTLQAATTVFVKQAGWASTVIPNVPSTERL